MRNTNKKGFTIIELVVVVAVIAILAAVLIPTFSGIIAKARLSADEQTVNNMNKYVAAANAEEEFAYPSDAVNALYANGFNMGKFETYSNGFHYAYDFEDNKFYLLDKEAKVVFPKNSDATAADLWGFFNNSKDNKIEGVKKYIALAPIGNADLFNAHDCVFAGTADYELDLNKYTVSVAGGKNIKLVNGTVLSGAVADSFTLDDSVLSREAKGQDLTEFDAVANVVTIENKVVAPAGSGELTFDADATAVVFKNCTINHTEIRDLNIRGMKSVTFDNCVINLPYNDDTFKALNIKAAVKTDVTIKNCYFSFARGIILHDDGDGTSYGNIVIENNVFANAEPSEGKPAIQFAGQSFEAESISIKDNDFVSGEIAIRLHDTIQSLTCSNLVISGNKFANGIDKVAGDNNKNEDLAADWEAKIK